MLSLLLIVTLGVWFGQPLGPSPGALAPVIVNPENRQCDVGCQPPRTPTWRALKTGVWPVSAATVMKSEFTP